MTLPNVSCEKSDLKFKEQIKCLLESGKLEELMVIVNDDKYNEELKKYSSEIIQLFGRMINADTFESNFELFECCESLIYHIAELAPPDDSILEFIELSEQNDEALFLVSLKAMKIPLLKLINKHDHALTWCLSSIIRRINELPQTEDLKLEGEECLILENSESCLKMAELYNQVVQFLESVVSHILTDSSWDRGDLQCVRYTLVTFCIKLLGRPLAYMSLENREIKGDFRLLAEKIVGNIIKFKWELTHFLNYVSSYNLIKKDIVSDVVDLDFNNVSLGVFYYLIFKEEIGLDHISFVYNPFFLFEMVCTLSLDMLLVENGRVQNKGLLLLESILLRITDSSLDLNKINGKLFGKLSEVLSNIMIYSTIQENRKIAVKTFKMLLIKFDSKGRYYVLYNIQNKVNQPNFIGYIITITKDFVIEALNQKDPTALKYFTGTNLCTILTRFCALHKGAESDLIELSDQIIASLNFVRFLLIRDKENMTGFSNFIKKLENDFLKPLKTGLSLSIAHYKLQKRELKNSPPGQECNVTVGGVELPSLSSDQKQSILETALTTFDVMQSLVARVEECLVDYKLTLS